MLGLCEFYMCAFGLFVLTPAVRTKLVHMFGLFVRTPAVRTERVRTTVRAY